MSDHFGLRSERPGIRLNRIELYNWGTFDSSDGAVYVAKPEGRTTLLVGRNGAGKSTLVDAILTLLVPNSIRNYNVAAGAKKTERTERTYVQGACDQQLGAEDSQVRKLYLRSGFQFYSVILAYFYDENIDSGFTLMQVLYPKADGSIDKVFAIGEGDKSIANDLQGLSKSEGLIATLKSRGFRATKTFTEYHEWFLRRTGVKPLAMDMFNQTVAVKDIRSLNAFIRSHMLESTGGKERVQRLIEHFSELRSAHRQLVRIRTQHDLLVPIEKYGKEYTRHHQELLLAERLFTASDAFFRNATIQLATPQVEACRQQAQAHERQRDELADRLKQASRESRQIENDIDVAGGERLKLIPNLIEMETARFKFKDERRKAFLASVQSVRFEKDNKDLANSIDTAEAFASLRLLITKRRDQIQELLRTTTMDRDDLVIERGQLASKKRELEDELEVLSRRRTNLPGSLARLRANLCTDLGVKEEELLFAAELMAVRDEEQAWESSIEMVLRGFALSLLVPDRLYRRVSGYIENHRLVDDSRGSHNARGQKLVYLKVGTLSDAGEHNDRLHEHSIVRKLCFREGHDLSSWISQHLQSRFDYRCCETMEEFRDAPRLAVTKNRHLKAGESRHEKDDRDKTTDPSQYVLGWNNQAKKNRLTEAIASLNSQIDRLNQRVQVLEDQLRLLNAESSAIERSLSVVIFDDIDSASHQRAIDALVQEKADLEASNDRVQLLRKKLLLVEKEMEELNRTRDEAVRLIGLLNQQIADGERLVSNAKLKVAQWKADRTWDLAEQVFDEIASELGDEPLAFESLFERERTFQKELGLRRDKLRALIEPVAERLTRAMGDFLKKCQEEKDDLDASLASLPSFLSKLELIRREDLPRYETRFKERLNDTVSKEMGVFNSELLQEGKHIQTKIDELNEALRELPYNAGTFMRLDMRYVKNAEISEFKNALRACLDDTFDNSPDANEARFAKMEKLISRLSEDSTWRERVIDVRRWYDFGACEIDRESGEQRSYYEDSSGQSGGEKARLAFTILVAAIAYQYDLDLTGHDNTGFHFVVVDEMFSKIDDRFAVYALKLFERFGLQLLIVAPLDAKARVTEPYVQHYLQVLKDEKSYRSQLVNMTAREYEEVLAKAGQWKPGESNFEAGRRRSPK